MKDPAGSSIKEKDVPAMFVFLTDPANICSLTGAALSTVSVAYIWQERYYLAVVISMIANIMDITDGQIARAMPGRPPALGIVGAKLDSHSDIISHFVVPACFLMKLSELNIACTLIGTCWVIAGVFRQSHLEVSGQLDNGEGLVGMTSDYIHVVVAIAMHLLAMVGRSNVTLILSICTLAMTYTLLAKTLRSRRYSGYGLLWVELYNISLTLSCLVLALTLEDGKQIGWYSFAGISFAVHLFLAYPCYFRFVELNTSV